MVRNQVERDELDRWMRRQAGHGIADEIQRQLTATKKSKDKLHNIQTTLASFRAASQRQSVKLEVE